MTADLITQKRAEIAAKIAAMKKNVPTASSRSVPASSVATPSPANTPVPAPTSHSGTPDSTEELLRRVAEAKRRVAEAQNKLAVKDNPYMVCRDPETLVLCLCLRATFQVPTQAGKKKQTVEPAQQGAGLKMAAHPLLLDNTPILQQSKKARYKPMQPKFASIKVCGFRVVGRDEALIVHRA